MSNEEQMREEFEQWFKASKYCQVIYRNGGHEVIAYDGWKACAAIKDAEIAKLRNPSVTTEQWKSLVDAANQLAEIATNRADALQDKLEKQDKEIAARDLMIKELREALEGIRLELGYEWLHDIFNSARAALAKSEHHNSRALEKKLLEARIDELKLAQDFFVRKDSYAWSQLAEMVAKREAKLSELNKE